MKYELVFEFDLDQPDVSLTDRYDQALEFETQKINNVTVIRTNIELPNKIKVHIQNIDPPPKIKLLSVSLGHIKFLKNSLDKLFVYHHPYGENRNTVWEYGGLAEFEFFEHNAIKYHLLSGTVI